MLVNTYMYLHKINIKKKTVLIVKKDRLDTNTCILSQFPKLQDKKPFIGPLFSSFKLYTCDVGSQYVRMVIVIFVEK